MSITVREFIERFISDFDKAYSDIAEKIAAFVYKEVISGVDLDIAIEKAYKKYGYQDYMLSNYDSELRSIISYGVKVGTFKKVGVSRNLINKIYKNEGVKLSALVHKNEIYSKEQIRLAVQKAFRDGRSIRELSSGLFDGYGYGKRLDLDSVLKVNKRLRSLSDKLSQQSKQSGVKVSKSLTSSIKSMEKYISKMQKTPLRTAYNELLQAIKANNEKRVLKALDTALQEKARSHATMIARTEAARVYGRAFEDTTISNPDNTGIKYTLSSSHKIFDICNVHTSVDYGYGKGVYPINKVPYYPFHPNCMCNMSSVDISKVPTGANITDKKIDESVSSYLNKIPKAKLQRLMNKTDASEFDQSGDWSGLYNWQGHRKAGI